MKVSSIESHDYDVPETDKNKIVKETKKVYKTCQGTVSFALPSGNRREIERSLAEW